MRNIEGALEFEALLRKKDFEKSINELKRDIYGLSRTTSKETQKMDESFKKLGAGIATYFTVGAVKDFVREIIDVRGEMQKLDIAFTTMLGSKAEADKLMSEIVQLAATTPFSLNEVANGAKQLLAFQVPANEVIDTLTRLGNIAAGLSIPLSRIQLVYGQVRAKGKLMGDDLRQFTEAGIPMISALADKLGKAESQIYDMVSAGEIGFNDVKEVLFQMTDAGGMFFNLMEKQSKTLSGKVSNIGDAFEQMLNNIGENNEGLLNNGLDTTLYLIENYEQLLSIIETLVVAYGAYRAALIVIAAEQKINITLTRFQAINQTSLNIAQKAGLLSTKALKTAWKGLNATLAANPITLIVAALAALAYQLYEVQSKTTLLEDSVEALNEANKESLTSIAEKGSKINRLVKEIRKENTTQEEKKKLLREIQTLTNGRIKDLSLEQIELGKSAKMIDVYIESLKAEAEIKNIIEQNAKDQIKVDELNKRIEDKDFSPYERFQGLFTKEGFKSIFSSAPDKAITDALVSNISGEIWEINHEMSLREKKIRDLADKHKLTIADILTDSPDTKPTDYKGKSKEVADKILPEGSIAYLRERLSKLNEVIDTTPISDSKLSSLITSRVNLEKQLSEAESKIVVKTQEEQIDEMLNRWKVYYAQLSLYGEESINEDVFSGFKDSSMAKYIEEQISALATVKSPTIETIQLMIELKEQLNEIKGVKSPFDNLTESINDIKDNSNSSFDALKKLNDLRDSLKKSDNPEDVKMFSTISDAIAQEQDNINALLNDTLSSFESYEEKKQSIIEKYNNLEATAVSKALSDPNFNLDDALGKLSKAYESEMSDISKSTIEASEDWKLLFDDIDKHSRSAILAAIKRLKDLTNAARDSGDISDSDYINIMKSINSVLDRTKHKLDLIKDSFDNVFNSNGSLESKIKSFGSLMGNSSEVISEVGGDLAGIFEDITGKSAEAGRQIISDISNIVSGFDSIAEGIATKDPVAIISGLGKVIGTVSEIFSGDRKRQKSIERHQRAVNALANAYKQLSYEVKNALGTDVYDTQRDMVANLEQQYARIEMMRREEKRKKKTDNNAVLEYENQLQDIRNTIDNIYRDITESITQTNAQSLADDLANALEEAYGRGEDAAKAYGKVADDVIRNAVRNALKLQFLEKPLQNAIEKLRDSMGFDAEGNGSFDGLTDEEIDTFKNMFSGISEQYMEAMNQFDDLFGSSVNGGEQGGMTGAIQSVTEDTAELISGQMNAIRINQVQILNLTREQNRLSSSAEQHLINIERYTENLIKIRADINDLRNHIIL